MIKVEVIRKRSEGYTTFVFESRDTSNEGMEKLDELYSGLLGSRLRMGGYLGSNRFHIDVKDEDTDA